MKVVRNIKEMQLLAETMRQNGETLAFVPTMGFLHEGHLSLLRIAAQRADKVVLSIFVNSAQFGPNEDFDSYPRDCARDLELAEREGVAVVFVPEAEEIYPPGYQSYVELTMLPKHLCGLSRPVFFRGIATVVTKLFHIVRPHFAVFGEKDFQQLAIIRQLVADLHFDIEIVGGPIVREQDGLAMSSRNAYLREDMRPAALTLSRALDEAKSMVASGVCDTEKIASRAAEIFAAYPSITVDYISLCDPKTLEAVAVVERPTLMALAVNLESIRLIDNVMLDPSQGK